MTGGKPTQRWRSTLCGALLTLVALILALSAQAEVSQNGNLRLTLAGKLRPERLPRRGAAPISVTLASRISTDDESLPPQLRTLRIELNRHGHLDHSGLSTCPYDRIQPGSSDHALAACRTALVGSGRFEAEITIAATEGLESQGRLLLFNGVRGGKHVLFGHIYSDRPFATSFVIVFRISHAKHGRFGTVLAASLPRAMDSWGRLTAISMTLSRRYHHRGALHSYLSSACPTPPGVARASFSLARTTFDFDGGARLTSVLTDTCRARG